MYLCNACGARLVIEGRVRPLIDIWYSFDKIPWKRTNCENCGCEVNCSNHLDAKPEYFDDKV